jgi:putative transposase
MSPNPGGQGGRPPQPSAHLAATRFKKVEHATALLWKVLQIAEFTFRRLQGAELLPAVYAGSQYVDGRQPTMSTEQRIAA